LIEKGQEYWIYANLISAITNPYQSKWKKYFLEYCGYCIPLSFLWGHNHRDVAIKGRKQVISACPRTTLVESFKSISEFLFQSTLKCW